MRPHVETLGAGAPLVLLHGWGFHSGVWGDFASGLARRFHVHLVDLPGHGHSSRMPLPTLDRLADAVCDEIPDNAIACGWSMGGLVAQHLASRQPRKVRALALVSSTPCFVSRSDWVHGVDEDTLAAFARDLDADRAGTLKRFVMLNTAPGAHGVARATLQRLAERPAASAQALEAGLELLRTVDLRVETPALACPVVVVHGIRDRIVPVGAGRWIAASVPGARLCELPGAAHLPFVSDRDAVLDAVCNLDG